MYSDSSHTPVDRPMVDIRYRPNAVRAVPTMGKTR